MAGWRWCLARLPRLLQQDGMPYLPHPTSPSLQPAGGEHPTDEGGPRPPPGGGHAGGLYTIWRVQPFNGQVWAELWLDGGDNRHEQHGRLAWLVWLVGQRLVWQPPSEVLVAAQPTAHSPHHIASRHPASRRDSRRAAVHVRHPQDLAFSKEMFSKIGGDKDAGAVVSLREQQRAKHATHQQSATSRLSQASARSGVQSGRPRDR